VKRGVEKKKKKKGKGKNKKNKTHKTEKELFLKGHARGGKSPY